MATRLSTGFVKEWLGTSSYSTIFDHCVIDFYSGSQPASANDSVGSATLLARATLDGGAFTEGVTTNGLVWDTVTSNVIQKPTAANWKYTGLDTGTIGWFRVRGNATDNGASSTTLPRWDGTAGITSGEARISVLDVVAGTPGTVNSCSFTVPLA